MGTIGERVRARSGRANFFQVSSASRARCEAALRLTAIFISCLRLCLAIGAWSASGRAIRVSGRVAGDAATGPYGRAWRSRTT